VYINKNITHFGLRIKFFQLTNLTFGLKLNIWSYKSLPKIHAIRPMMRTVSSHIH